MPETEIKPEDKQIEPEVEELQAPEVDEVDPSLEPEDNSLKPDVKKTVHPLTPGGRRFEQVYAESKQAKRDLAHERELRIAAEARLSVLDKGQPTVNESDVEYDWPQLEQFIAAGRITRADAEAHRESVLTKKVTKQIKGEFTQENSTATRNQALTKSIASYVESQPDILVEGSDERVRLDEEFDFLVSIQGVDASKLDETQRKAFQLTALRNVYGSVDSLNKRSVKPKGETHQGLPGGTRPKPSTNPDQAILDGLSKREVVHYNKMFRAGRYPNGWKDVVAELKYTPKG